MTRVLKLILLCFLVYSKSNFFDFDSDPSQFDLNSDDIEDDLLQDTDDDSLIGQTDSDESPSEEGPAVAPSFFGQNISPKGNPGVQVVIETVPSKDKESIENTHVKPEKKKYKKSKFKKFMSKIFGRKSKTEDPSIPKDVAKIQKAQRKAAKKAEKKAKKQAKKEAKRLKKLQKKMRKYQPIEEEIIPQEYYQPQIPRISRLVVPRMPFKPLYGKQVHMKGYPMSFEMELEKVNSQPAHGFIRSMKYVNGKPVYKEKIIETDDIYPVKNHMPIMFDPFRTPLETQEGQRTLMDSLDNMLGLTRRTIPKANEEPPKDKKQTSLPCDLRKTCEECTVDYSCFYCSSKRQCIPAKYFGTDSFTGSHCPASDIYYFETCKVKSFVFMFFLIIIVLCLLFTVIVMGFSLIWRRTRRAKIYNVIKEKEDQMESEGKNHPLID